MGLGETPWSLIAVIGWGSAVLTALSGSWSGAFPALFSWESHTRQSDCTLGLREVARLHRDLEWWRPLIWILVAALALLLFAWSCACCGACVCARGCCDRTRDRAQAHPCVARAAIVLEDFHTGTRLAPRGQAQRVSGHGVLFLSRALMLSSASRVTRFGMNASCLLTCRTPFGSSRHPDSECDLYPKEVSEDNEALDGVRFRGLARRLPPGIGGDPTYRMRHLTARELHSFIGEGEDRCR